MAQPGGRSPSFYANPRCRDLEQQLNGGSSGAQNLLPQIESDIRQADGAFRRAQADADRADCYEEMFLFGRSLKRTPRCVDLDRQIQNAKARLTQLKAQQDSLTRGSSDRGRRDQLVAELARNNCGDNYAREYERQRSRNSSIFSFFSDEESEDASRSLPPTISTSGYQTKCVRLCDGFYFPISFSASESQLQEDAAKCQSQCASPAELYYHRGDQEVAQMVSLQGRPYTSLPNAFRNRKAFIKGCSCNANEYSVAEIAKSEEALRQGVTRRADASGKKSDALAQQEAAPAQPQQVQTQPASSPGPAPASSGGAFRPTLSNPQVLTNPR
jgi:hypothetical protein